MPKSQRTSGGSSDDAVLALLNISVGRVLHASQHLEESFDEQQRQRLPKIQNELILFFYFALDYWIQMSVHTKKEQQAIIEALSYHWAEAAGGGHEGQIMLDTLQERFDAYSQIVNEGNDDTAKFFGLGKKLSEFCGIPGNPYLLVLAPQFFTESLEYVGIAFSNTEGKKYD